MENLCDHKISSDLLDKKQKTQTITLKKKWTYQYLKRYFSKGIFKKEKRQANIGRNYLQSLSDKETHSEYINNSYLNNKNKTNN